ncbi:MAG: autotransporter outer membrane beta-barrel domain-containing protein [Alphaproteobacteria bacterium]|jgi:outer membrane autotransporter protein|nr:autotransporter outer membrane beta-barrel domain-containing protein [Alphaproteobacteria bacterium]
MRKISTYTVFLSLAFSSHARADIEWILGTSGDLQNSNSEVVMSAECVDGVCNLIKTKKGRLVEEVHLDGDEAVLNINTINLFSKDDSSVGDFLSEVVISGTFNNDTDGENVDINIYKDFDADGTILASNTFIRFLNTNIDGNIYYEGEMNARAKKDSTASHFNRVLSSATILGDVTLVGDSYLDYKGTDWIVNSYFYRTRIEGDLKLSGNYYTENVSNQANTIMLRDTNVLGSFMYDGNIEVRSGGLATGVWMYRGSIGEDIVFNSNIKSVGGSAYGFMTHPTLAVTGDLNFTGDFDIKATGAGAGFILNGLTVDNVNVNSDMEVISGENSRSFYFSGSTINGDLNFDGSIYSVAGGDSFGYIMKNTNMAGSLFIDADLYSKSNSDDAELNSDAIKITETSSVGGNVQLSGNIKALAASDNIVSKAFAVEETSSVVGDVTYSSGAMNAETAVYVDDTSFITGLFTNNGSIKSTLGSAIEYYGSDNAFTYSGNGELKSSVHQIDMGEGVDTLDIVNATIENINVNSAETLNITDSTMNLSLTVDNKSGALMQTSGTTALNFTNVTLNINPDYDAITSYNIGDTFVVAEADTISNDLTQLTLNINNYNADGTLSIYNDGSGDQLIYTFSEIPTFDTESGAINPGQGAQVDLASSGVFQSSVSSAASASAAVLDVVQGRQMARKYDDILSENSQFASLDAIVMSDAGNIFGIDKDKKHGVWMQLTSKKDSYDGAVKSGSNGLSSTGYDSDSFGITVGYDQKLSNELLAGVSLTYSKGDAEGKFNSFETDMDSVQLSLYGSYLMDDRMFLDAIVGYGIGSYDQKRNTGSDIASADYDSTQISLAATVGKVYLHKDRMLLTPFVKGSYINVKQDAYDETGSTANLSVESVSFDSFQASLGMDFGYVFQLDNYGTIMPTAKIELAREMGDNAFAIDSTVRGTGLAGASYTSPDMGRSILRMGAGVTYLNEKGHEVSFDYENESRDNFDSNTLYLKGKYMF